MGWRREFCAGLVACCAVVPSCALADRSAAPHVECSAAGCQCAPGFGNCDAREENGCETDVAGNPLHCGGCGYECLTGTCDEGTCHCTIAGYDDCDRDPRNGCETDVTSDPRHCGVCDRDCQGAECRDMQCRPLVLAADAELAERLALGPTHATAPTRQ